VSEPAAKLWLIQVDSDLLAAARVWDALDERTYCQAIAKYQQAVEKSVKAVFAALKDAGVILPPIGYEHGLSKQLSLLEKLPKAAGATIQGYVDGLLTRYHRAEIATISALAPKKPDVMRGEIHRLNTEYPYELSVGIWTVPAATGVFTQSQIMRFETLAMYLYHGACKIVSTLRL
jgi:hypothetical protein